MQRAPEVTPENIRKALAETKDFQGATGKITMDPDRNATKPVVIVQIKDKKFTFKSEALVGK
jgi:branched-chain amino acid transport system substrate-binding protein